MVTPESLVARLASLQRSGCSDKISWSRSGAVAYISGSVVYLTHVACTDGEKWTLAPPVLIPNLYVIHREAPIVHISWSPTGGDLACFDTNGEMSVFSTGPGGEMSCTLHPSSSVDSAQPSDLNAVVGFKWLDLEKPVLMASPAVRLPSGTSSRYLAVYALNQGVPSGPYHPGSNRQACISVNRRGVIRLAAQAKSGVRYFPVTASLAHRQGSKSSQSNGSSIPVEDFDLISHATWKGCRDNTLLLITYSSQSSHLRAYRITIKWAASLMELQQKPAPGTHQSPEAQPPSEIASFNIERLISCPLEPQSSSDDPLPDLDSLSLTQLLAVPNLPQKSNQPNNAADADHEFYAVFSSLTDSILYKYSLTKRQVSLHPTFYLLSARRDGAKQDEQETKLNLIETIPPSVESKGPIVGLNFVVSETFLAKLYASGEVELLYRGPPPQPQQKAHEYSSSIVSLLDAGFKFSRNDITDAYLSPNLASYVYLTDAGELKLHHVDGPGDGTIQPGSDAFANVCISLALRHSVSCFNSLCTHDLYCVILKLLSEMKGTELHDKFLYALLQESHRAVNFSLDLAKDYHIDKVMVNPSLQRLLSMQMALGSSHNWKRNVMSRVAWAVLNVRLLAFSLTFTLRAAAAQSKSQVPLGPADMELKAGHILSMLGFVRWSTDLVAFICQELYLASLDPAYFESRTKSNKPSVAISLLLANVPRLLLIYSLRGIRGLDQISLGFVDQERNPVNGYAAAAHKRLKDLVSMAPVPLHLFEKMLTELENTLKRDNALPPDRLSIEQKLIFEAQIPKEVHPVMNHVVRVFKESVLPEIDVARLHFYDVSWLGLEDDEDDGPVEQSELEKQLSGMVDGSRKETRDEVDVLRKLIISDTSERKRLCVRCGGVSIWEDPKPPIHSHWTVAFQKNCLCGGNWYSI